jgi:hypothetical protein
MNLTYCKTYHQILNDVNYSLRLIQYHKNRAVFIGIAAYDFKSVNILGGLG